VARDDGPSGKASGDMGVSLDNDDEDDEDAASAETCLAKKG
jgi:hypothetical protein